MSLATKTRRVILRGIRGTQGLGIESVVHFEESGLSNAPDGRLVESSAVDSARLVKVAAPVGVSPASEWPTDAPSSLPPVADTSPVPRSQLGDRATHGLRSVGSALGIFCRGLVWPKADRRGRPRVAGPSTWCVPGVARVWGNLGRFPTSFEFEYGRHTGHSHRLQTIGSGYWRPGRSFAFDSFDHVIHRQSLSARVLPIVISRSRVADRDFAFAFAYAFALAFVLEGRLSQYGIACLPSQATMQRDGRRRTLQLELHWAQRPTVIGAFCQPQRRCAARSGSDRCAQSVGHGNARLVVSSLRGLSHCSALQADLPRSLRPVGCGSQR